jgi:Carbohydrate esterase, sialic acid-specific acetylesterase
VTTAHRISLFAWLHAGARAHCMALVLVASTGCESALDADDSSGSDGGLQTGGNSAAGNAPALTDGGGIAAEGGEGSTATRDAGGSASGSTADGGSRRDSGTSGDAGRMADGGIDAGSDGGRALDAGGDGALARDAALTDAATFHVFLLLGQSNMAGYPKAQQADKAEDPRIKVLGYDNCAATGRQIDKWDTAAPPLHECGIGAIGPGDYFAKTLIELVPQGHTIGLVPCAISGEKIETFLKVGGNKYGSIVQRAKLAQQAGGVIDGIIFHQGESNNGDGSWPGKVNTLVTDLRSDLGLGNVPFIAGELLYSGSCAGHNTLVNKLPGVVSNAYVVSADGLVVDPADTQWNLHFGHDSQVTFGKRYAEKMKAALGW